MKKRIFNLVLVLVLMITVLFSLTACESNKGEEDDEIDTSTAKGAIEAFADAINDHDANKIIELFDVEGYEEVSGEEFEKKEAKEKINDFFDEYDDFKIKVKKITLAKNDEDFEEEISDEYDSYEEYIEDGEDSMGVDNLDVYTVELVLPDEFDDCYMLEDVKKDVIIVRKVDDEYKIFSSISLYSIMYKYENDETIEQSVVKPAEDASRKTFNAQFESYEGEQTGTNVEYLISEVISSNTRDNNTVFVSFYGEDYSEEEYDIYESTDLNMLKSKIESNHYYTIEVEENDDGYVEDIYIYY